MRTLAVLWVQSNGNVYNEKLVRHTISFVWFSDFIITQSVGDVDFVVIAHKHRVEEKLGKKKRKLGEQTRRQNNTYTAKS